MDPYREWRGKSWPYNSWRQRFFEAFGILTGRFSLHRAFQVGLDEGSANEYRRLITNKGYMGEIPIRLSAKDMAIYESLK